MTAEIRRLNPDGVSAPLGPYAHAVEVPPGASLLFVAGQVSVDERGDVVGEGDLAAQMRQVFANLNGVLTGAGYGWEHVVKTTTFLSRSADVDEYRAKRMPLYERYFAARRYPASTVIVVERLALEAFLLEVEAIAAR